MHHLDPGQRDVLTLVARAEGGRVSLANLALLLCRSDCSYRALTERVGALQRRRLLAKQRVGRVAMLSLTEAGTAALRYFQRCPGPPACRCPDHRSP